MGLDCKYGYCSECHYPLSPVWFIEEEIKITKFGGITSNYKTGRKRKAVDYLLCKCCGHKECVDDTFDGDWYK